MSISINYFLNIIMTITGILVPIITFPYISRTLMPEYVGKITFAQSIVFYFTTLSLLGIPVYGVRELSKVRNKISEFKSILLELLIIGIVGSILSFGLIFLVINLSFKLREIKDILYIFSIQVIFSFLNLDYLFIVLEKHKRRALRSLFLRVISLFLIFTFVKSYSDYRVYAFILIMPEIIMRTLDLFSIREYIDFKSNLNIRRHFKSLLILFTSSLSVSLYISLDSTMLGLMQGETSVGLYTSASKMSKILIPLIVALETVISPELIHSIKERNKNKIFEKIDLFLNFNFILGVQFIFILFILSKDVILFFSGENFLAADKSFKIMLPIIFFIPVGAFMSGKILISNGLEKLSLKLNLIGMFLNAGLNYFLIKKYGIAGAGFATLFTEGIMCILKCLEVKKIYPDYNFISKDRLKYILIGGVLTLILLKVKNQFYAQNYILNILSVGIGYVLIYFTILVLIKDKLINKILLKNK